MSEDCVENPYQSPVCRVDSDEELLRRFTTDKDQGAFEELVRRHGPLVWSVCRGVLGCRQDAEDAFQAAFLVLLRQADSIRKRNSFRSWLIGVARRVAMKALRTQYRRLQFLHRLVRRRESGQSSPAAFSDEIWGVVDDELAGLPEVQRVVIQKCVFDGHSYQQVSDELNIPVGTVASHLRRGRQVLRGRLVSRGISAAGAAVAMTTLSYAAQSPPASLCESTVRNAALLLSGDQAALPARIVSLMKGVAIKMTVTAKCILALALSLGAGASTWWVTNDKTGQQPVPTLNQVEAGPSIHPALVLEVDVPGIPSGAPSIEFVAEPTAR